MAEKYGSYFFTDFYEKNGGGDYTDKESWFPFFSMVADNIIKEFNPKTVLDAGCALGYVVEALRDKGVEAYGFDISDFAISNVREDIKPFCFVHSITDKIPEKYPQRYDLVITIEVMEHLSEKDGAKAIKNLCQYSDTIVFTSTPNDITDMTHINVRLSEYWCREFAKNQYYREYLHPVDFICPWAMVFNKYDAVEDAIFDQEMGNRIISHKKELDKKNEMEALIQQKDADYIKMASEKDRDYRNAVEAKEKEKSELLELIHQKDVDYLKMAGEKDRDCQAAVGAKEKEKSELLEGLQGRMREKEAEWSVRVEELEERLRRKDAECNGQVEGLKALVQQKDVDYLKMAGEKDRDYQAAVGAKEKEKSELLELIHQKDVDYLKMAGEKDRDCQAAVGAKEKEKSELLELIHQKDVDYLKMAGEKDRDCQAAVGAKEKEKSELLELIHQKDVDYLKMAGEKDRDYQAAVGAKEKEKSELLELIHQKDADYLKMAGEKDRDCQLLEALQGQMREKEAKYSGQVEALQGRMREKEAEYRGRVEALAEQLRHKDVEYSGREAALAEQLQCKEAEYSGQMEALQGQMREKEAEYSGRAEALQGQMREKEAEYSGRVEALQGQMREKEAEYSGRVEALQGQMREKEAEYSGRAEALAEQLRYKEVEYNNLYTVYIAIENATFWRMTKPMRVALDLLKTIFKKKKKKREQLQQQMEAEYNGQVEAAQRQMEAEYNGQVEAAQRQMEAEYNGQLEAAREELQQQMETERNAQVEAFAEQMRRKEAECNGQIEAMQRQMQEKEAEYSAQLEALRGQLQQKEDERNLSLKQLPAPQPEVIDNRSLEEKIPISGHSIHPIKIIKIDSKVRRANLVLDSIGSESLFGGVATALIIATKFAVKYEFELRIITRTSEANPLDYCNIMNLNHIKMPENVSFYSDAPSSNQNYLLEVSPDDIFIAGPWWSAKAIMRTTMRERFFWIVQDVETFFYPAGAEQMLCDQTFKTKRADFIVNSRFLYDYFTENYHHISRAGIYFEPAFSDKIYYKTEDSQSGKRKLFFYSRPNNPRNLFSFGVRILDEALTTGIIDTDEWEIYFAGQSVPDIEFSTGYKPVKLNQLSWNEYADFLRGVDLTLSLMYTPHPSYPPYDAACSGSVVVTNQFMNKKNFYQCKNVIMAELTIDKMLTAIQEGINLTKNSEVRNKNYQEMTIYRDWDKALEKTLEFMGEKINVQS